ncbi:HNH endonuclease signature motif containing protein [Herbiconiux liangxiaofengii]|uniref:HNH endonuclease signature motif containing protein n=1 Tax=Herbiconiux liangxiaofengii TaxID=3342795 RepID=UPI0035B7CF77
MKQSVAFTAASSDPTTGGTRESMLRGIGVDADEVAVIQREQAMLDGRAVVRLAAAARKANWVAGLPGGSLQHARRSLVAEVATTLRIPERTAGQRIDDAEMLCDFLPATLEALGRGDITYRHAQAVVRQARTLPEKVRAEFETIALVNAESQTPTQLSTHARNVRERMHPDSIDARHREARDERGVWVEKELDGMATLVCHLPAVSALAIDDTLDQLARGLRAPDEARTHAQLRADCLTDLLLDRDGDTATRARGITANIAVTVPVMTLLGHGVEAGELAGYGPIDTDTARRLVAGAPSVLRILTDPATGTRLTVGRERYKVPADLRAAVIMDDQTCRFPGCTRDAARCDLDHTVDWANGGHTSLDNLAALCRRHHTLKHQTDWQVTGGEGRALHWTSPSGARHTTTPPEHPPARIPRPARPLPEHPPF